MIECGVVGNMPAPRATELHSSRIYATFDNFSSACGSFALCVPVFLPFFLCLAPQPLPLYSCINHWRFSPLNAVGIIFNPLLCWIPHYFMPRRLSVKVNRNFVLPLTSLHPLSLSLPFGDCFNYSSLFIREETSFL